MYKFDLSVSTTGSRVKEEIKFNTLSFEKKNLTIGEFIDYIKSGHTFCYCFNQSKFHITYKKLKNFDYSSVIAFDIDDTKIAMNDYVSNLPFKPSVNYTTYSNGEDGFYSYRLVYFFNDRSTSIEQYKSLYYAIINANDMKLKDNCMSSINQCFIGNGKSNVEVINNNIIYNISDFNDYITTGPECKNKIIKSNNNSTVNILTLHSGRTTNDYINLSFEEYYNKYKDTYKQFSSSELEYNEDGYALITEDYISIYRKYLWITDDNGKRICIKIKWKDGERRFKKLFCSALLRRKIKNDITFDELLFNTVIELEYYYFNADNRFSKKDIIRIVEKVMKLPIDKINSIEHFKDGRKFTLDPNKYNGRKEKSAARQEIRKKLNYEEISKFYNTELKDKENLKILKDNGIKITRQTLSNFKKEMGIKRITKNEQIGSMYDPTLTDKENVEVMKEYGLIVTTDDLRKWRYNNGVKIIRPECKNKIIKSNNNSTVNILTLHSGRSEELNEETKNEISNLYVDAKKKLQTESQMYKTELYRVNVNGIFEPFKTYLDNCTNNDIRIYGANKMLDLVTTLQNKQKFNFHNSNKLEYFADKAKEYINLSI